MSERNRVKELREAAGMRVEELAYRVGVSATTIRSVEAGAKQPRLGTAQRIARALRHDIDSVFPPEPAEATA